MGFSSDDMETIKRFADEHGITFPLISDRKEELKALYPRRRITYLIDRKGTVRLIQRGVPANEYFIEKIKAMGIRGSR